MTNDKFPNDERNPKSKNRRKHATGSGFGFRASSFFRHSSFVIRHSPMSPLMTLATLILRSVRFHARAHLGALLGAAIGSAVLIGALVVGDSVRGSLREMALARLGKVRLALAANDRFFRAALAEDLQRLAGGTVVAAMTLPATVNTPDDSARANRVQAVGVDDRFWLLSEGRPSFKAPSATQVVLNASLAGQLKVK